MRQIKVDKNTMLFMNLTEEECQELDRITKRIIHEQFIEWSHPLVIAWMDSVCANVAQKIIFSTSIMPEKFLLSIK